MGRNRAYFRPPLTTGVAARALVPFKAATSHGIHTVGSPTGPAPAIGRSSRAVPLETTVVAVAIGFHLAGTAIAVLEALSAIDT